MIPGFQLLVKIYPLCQRPVITTQIVGTCVYEIKINVEKAVSCNFEIKRVNTR